MNTEKIPQIFIAHASEDKPLVRELYSKLVGAGYKPWLDEEELLPGQNWRE
ncbi:MAG: toll/interleukin-1 receptor domain-containing protein, partial [Crocosphaera sp.]